MEVHKGSPSLSAYIPNHLARLSWLWCFPALDHLSILSLLPPSIMVAKSLIVLTQSTSQGLALTCKASV
jgi:hypothetical protein